jgi:hypothetical protein
MTPKQKAEELHNKFYKINEGVNLIYFEEAKQCALIAVDEILGDIDDSILHPQNKEAIDYWQEVKKEIENI